MIRDYMVVSPSLDGVLRHDSVIYEGLRRPAEILRILDGPSSKGSEGRPLTKEELEILSGYFNDLYGVFLKKLALFAMSASVSAGESLKLQALFQEILKIKKMMGAQESVDTQESDSEERVGEISN
jgi:hypothetical protein